MKYGNRSLGKKLLTSPFSALALVVFAVILVRAAINISAKAALSNDKLSQAQTELAALKDRQAEVARKVAILSTEHGMEAEIRTKYHAVKEGESVAVIVPDSQTASGVNASDDATSTQPLSWWRRLLRMFGL